MNRISDAEQDRRRDLRATAMNKSQRKEWRFVAASKYASACIWCGERLRVGEQCRWHPEAKAVHEACFHEAFDSVEAESGTLVCKCGHSGPPSVVESGPHLRANCVACGGYLKFVARVEPWISLALNGASR